MWRVSRAGRLEGPRLFLKARSAWWLPVLAVATLLVGVSVPEGLVEVPLRNDAKTLLDLVAIGLPAGLATLFLRRPSRYVELPVSRLVRARYAWWAASYASLTGCAAFGLVAWGNEGAFIGLRNSGILMALTTLAARVVAVEWAWVPALAFTGVSLLYGTNGPEGAPYAWALLQQAGTSPAAMTVWVLLTVFAWAGYARHDIRAVDA